MKQKLIASGLVLSLLFSGATYSSASVKPIPATETVLTVIDGDDNMDAKFWAAVGEAAYWLLSGNNRISDPQQKNIFGAKAQISFQYEEVKELFDN